MNYSWCAILLAVNPTILNAAPGDENWDPKPGLFESNSVIRSIVFFNGSLYVGGTFSFVQGVAATNIVRWDGTNWLALGSGISGTVETIAVNDDYVFVGGQFSEAGGVSVTNVAKWNGLNWSPLGDGLNNIVFELVVGSDGLYAGGHFATSGSTIVNHVAKWDGTSWTSLGGGISHSQIAPFVSAMAVVDSTLYVGGRFTTAGSTQATNVAKWDGNTWMPLGCGVNGTVHALAAAEIGVYAGGNFNKAGNQAARNVAFWDGNEWSALGDGITSDRTPGIAALKINGGQIFVGGVEFYGAGGVNSTNIAMWDGQRWFTMGQGILGRYGGSVNTLASTGTELFVGGFFDFVGGKPSSHFAIWRIPHSLSISRTGDQVQVSWPATGTNFLLEAKSDLNDTDWVEVSPPPDVLNEECVVTETVTGTNRIYRLRRKP